MATVKQLVGTRTSLTATGMDTLASGNYIASSAYDCSVNQPDDVVVELTVATTNTPTSNKQVVAFIQESLDGTNYRTGPTSGSTTTEEPNLRYLGTLPLPLASTTERATFSVFQALGYLPDSFKVVLKNDLGVALTSGTLYTSEISTTVA